jgi:hypothetical protein
MNKTTGNYNIFTDDDERVGIKGRWIKIMNKTTGNNIFTDDDKRVGIKGR